MGLLEQLTAALGDRYRVARALSAASTEQLTQSGIVVGTPQYMRPEQAAGSAVDGRSDQYSLACTLYEMLIGQPPFSGPSSQVVIARYSLEPVPSLRLIRRTVSPSVEGAVMQAMAKLPADRFASMQRFLDALASPEATAAGGGRVEACDRAGRQSWPFCPTNGDRGGGASLPGLREQSG